MKLFNNFLVFTFVFFFISCDKRPQKQGRWGVEDLHGMSRSRKLARSYEVVWLQELIEAVKKTNEEVEKLPSTLVDMMEGRHHEINTLSNEIINKRKVALQAIDQLKAEVMTLEDILQNTDWPKEAHDRIQIVKEGLERIQEVLKESAQLQVEELLDESEASTGESEASSGESEASAGESEASSGESEASSGESEASSGESEASSGESEASSGESEASSGESEASSGESEASTGESRASAAESATKPEAEGQGATAVTTEIEVTTVIKEEE